MKQYQFLGNLEPKELLKFTNFKLKSLDVESYNGNKIGDITVEIENDNLRVTLLTDIDTDLPTIRNSLEYFVKGVVDSCNYFFGIAVDVHLPIGGFGPSEIYEFPPKANVIFKDQTSRPFLPVEIIELTAKNPPLHRALGDLREAIKNPLDTAFYCYRAIEAIRQNFLSKKVADDGKNKKESWNKMGEALLFEQSYKKSLEKNAEYTRHGGARDLTGTEIEEMLLKTWIIVDRFCIYLKRKRKLSKSKFQILQ